MGEQGTIIAQTTWDILDTAEIAGVPRQTIIDASGFDPALYKEPDQRVPIHLHCAVWVAAMRKVRDPGFVIKVAERKTLEGFQSMGFLGASSATVLEALNSVIRYMPIYASDSTWRMEQTNQGWAVVEEVPSSMTLGQRCGSEISFACLVHGLRLILKDRIGPLSVEFLHSEPSSIEAHTRFFDRRPRFSAPKARLVFSNEFCHREIPTHSPQLHRILTQHAELMMEKQPRAASFREQVEHTVHDLLQRDSSTLTADRVARRMGASVRTLRRRLESEGTTFVATVAEVRRRLAERYLTEERLSVDEVANRLGFSDASAFRRAFKRWTGQSPGLYLGQQRGSLAAESP